MDTKDFKQFTGENFINFFKEFTPEKVSDLPIESQRELKENLREEMQRRISLCDAELEKFKKLGVEYSECINDIKTILELQDKGYKVNDILEQAKEKEKQMDSEIKSIEKYLKSEKNTVNLINSSLKSNKFSEQKKHISNFKLKLKSAPQKVCSANIRFLNKIRENGKKKYFKLYEDFNSKLTNSEVAMEALEQDKIEIMKQNSDMNAFERYAAGIETEKKQKKEYKKIKKYGTRATLLAKLKNGVVRSFDTTISMYNKLNDQLEKKQGFKVA